MLPFMGGGVDVQGWPHPLYLALSFLAKAEKPQDKFYHLVNLSLEKENDFSKILQQL